MTGCLDRELALQGLVDGELDSLNSLQLEVHLNACKGCSAALDRLMLLRARLQDADARYRAPPTLRHRIEALVAAEPVSDSAPTTRGTPKTARSWIGGGAFGALAASLLLVVAAPQLTATTLQEELVASHIRSLQADHLTDVATSDRHVVKPWFNGKIDYSPPVVELRDRGFPLIGGRLDYVGGKQVAALVYRRRLHTINLFIRPAPAIDDVVSRTMRHDSYSLVRWVAGGLEYWAVSDVEPADLEAFRRAFREASGT